MHRHSADDAIANRLTELNGLVVRLAERLLAQAGVLTAEIDELTDELTGRVQRVALSLLAHSG